MVNKHNRRKPSSKTNIWLGFGVFIIFVLIGFAILAILLLMKETNRMDTPVLPSATTSSQPTPTVVPLTPTDQPSPTSPSPTPQIYIVKQGDTLYSISAEFGVTVDALKSVNALSSDMIFVNQTLIIPTGDAAFESPTSEIPVGAQTPGLVRYQVLQGDTLESIAAVYGLETNEVRAANAMVGDTIIPGQYITIPLGGPVANAPWNFSTSSGDFSQQYPLSLNTDRFTLHYQPGTYPSQDPNILAQIEQNALNFLESFTGMHLNDKYDLYVAGTNFQPPNRALRGITFSTALKTFFLHDGTGNVDDQQYIATHELTHLFMWNTVGSPSSTMISEGMAVYAGMELIRDSEHMPIEEFCAIYLQAGALPAISSNLSFLGHVSDLQNYYASGCFVKFLVDTYGMESVIMVYHTGDYSGVFGKSLSSLEEDWKIHLGTIQIPTGISALEFVGAVKDMENSYESFFPNFSGSPTQFAAYRELDKARIALLEGDILAMRNSLSVFDGLR